MIEGAHPRVVAEFEDSALLKQFGQHGEGLFAGPTAIEHEIIDQYGLRVVGKTNHVVERFYAITVERRIKHPAVRAISDAAHEGIFG
jgi:LysR family transcriptional activator of nhaA